MKKYFSLIVSFCIILLSINTTAVAYHNESLVITKTIEDNWIVDIKGENLNFQNNEDKKFYYQDSEFATVYNCYQFLDDAQKFMYDSIIKNHGKLSFMIYFDNGVFLYDNFTQDYFTKVMMALCTDRPELFYYAGYSIGGGKLYSNQTHIEYIQYNVGVYDSALYTESNLPGYYNALMSTVPQVPVDTTNRYLFVKSVHDYLANTVYYPDLNSTDYVMSAHDAYGALVEGRAVCQGYSDAFKLICDYYKIPCVCISGTSDGVGHMWNAVQMDDGKWYFLDITWDDQTNRTYYDFFLVGLNTNNTYFDGEAFSQCHVNDSDLLLPLLNYAIDKYSQVNHNTEFKATYNSLAINEGKYLIRSYFDIADTYVYYNGMYVETGGLTTNGVFKAPSGANGTEEEWTLVILGDCNADGDCNALDYSSAVNIVIQNNQIEDAYDMAIDIDCDGCLDVLDLAMIQLLVNGFSSDIEIE